MCEKFHSVCEQILQCVCKHLHKMCIDLHSACNNHIFVNTHLNDVLKNYIFMPQLGFEVKD